MELENVLTFCRRWIGFLGLGPAVMVVAALVTIRQIPPAYEAQVTLQINPGSPGTINDVRDVQQLGQTYVEAIRTRPVLEQALSLAAVSMSPTDFARRVTPRLVRDTQLLRVTVTDEDPNTAARLANALVNVFMTVNQEAQASQFAGSRENLGKLVDSLRAELDTRNTQVQDLQAQAASPSRDADLSRLQTEMVQLQSIYGSTVRSYEDLRVAEARGANTLTVLEPAIPPETPVFPRPLQAVVLAAVAGLALSICVALAGERLTDRIGDGGRVASETGLAIFGRVPIIRPRGQALLGLLSHPRADSYRLVLSSLLATLGDESHRTLLVASPEQGDGKTTVSAGVAIALAESGVQVVLLDADFHRPAQADLFEVANDDGLSTLLLQRHRPASGVLCPTQVANLWIVPSGPPVADPSRLLSSQNLDQRLRELHRLCDVIVVDTSPVLATPDAALLGSRADAVILVLDATRSRRRRARQAIQTLRASGATIAGLVLNKAPMQRSPFAGYAQKATADLQPEVGQLDPAWEATPRP